MNSVELDPRKVGEMKETIWSILGQTDSKLAKEEYARHVAAVSHPAGILRGRVVKGTRRLQHLLNALIAWRRLCWLFYAVLVILAITLSWWSLLGCICILVSAMIANSLQTHINVELAARLYVLDQMVEDDPEFSKAVERAMHGILV